jgi:hypothetical protein
MPDRIREALQGLVLDPALLIAGVLADAARRTTGTGQQAAGEAGGSGA